MINANIGLILTKCEIVKSSCGVRTSGWWRSLRGLEQGQLLDSAEALSSISLPASASPKKKKKIGGERKYLSRQLIPFYVGSSDTKGASLETTQNKYHLFGLPEPFLGLKQPSLVHCVLISQGETPQPVDNRFERLRATLPCSVGGRWLCPGGSCPVSGVA